MADYSLRDAFNNVLASRIGTSDLFSVFDGWKQTDAEIAAGVTPVASQWQPGNLFRYGAIGGNATLDTAAWLSAVALTLTTASRQVSGANRSVGFGARSLGLMHLRVSMPSVGASTCACNMDVAGVSNAKTAARIISRRRVFICVFLLMRRVRMDLRKRASDAILEVLRTSGEVYFVTSAS